VNGNPYPSTMAPDIVTVRPASNVNEDEKYPKATKGIGSSASQNHACVRLRGMGQISSQNITRYGDSESSYRQESKKSEHVDHPIILAEGMLSATL